MTKPHTIHPSSTSSRLGIDKDSQMISKVKPKIRIIHLFPPEIIKTDAANFRELVQRLTGKPEDETDGGGSKIMTPPKDLVNLRPRQTITMEEEEFQSQQSDIRVKNEDKGDDRDDEMRRRSKSKEKFSGFFDGFSELDGFMEELNVLPVVDLN